MSQDSPDSEEMPEEESEGSANLVYAIATAPGFTAGEQGEAFAGLNFGLFRTLDGGASWQYSLETLHLSEPLPVTSLALSPDFARDGKVFGGTTGGLFYSKDHGQNWAAITLPSPPPNVSALAISPHFVEDETLFAGTLEDGIFVSTDGGQRWITWNFGLLDLNILCLAISPAFQQDETLFAGTETGIFRSTNGGRAWREVDVPFGFDAILTLAISPRYAEDHTVFAGAENHGVFVSRDEGDTWQSLGSMQFDEPINHLLLDHTDSRQMMAVTSQGLWCSADGGETWENRLPPTLLDEEISVVCAPQNSLNSPLLVGLVGGEIMPFSI